MCFSSALPLSSAVKHGTVHMSAFGAPTVPASRRLAKSSKSPLRVTPDNFTNPAGNASLNSTALKAGQHHFKTRTPPRFYPTRVVAAAAFFSFPILSWGIVGVLLCDISVLRLV